MCTDNVAPLSLESIQAVVLASTRGLTLILLDVRLLHTRDLAFLS